MSNKGEWAHLLQLRTALRKAHALGALREDFAEGSVGQHDWAQRCWHMGLPALRDQGQGTGRGHQGGQQGICLQPARVHMLGWSRSGHVDTAGNWGHGTGCGGQQDMGLGLQALLVLGSCSRCLADVL